MPNLARLLYRSALAAQRQREALLAAGDYPGIDTVKPSSAGTFERQAVPFVGGSRSAHWSMA